MKLLDSAVIAVEVILDDVVLGWAHSLITFVAVSIPGKELLEVDRVVGLGQGLPPLVLDHILR